MTYRKLEKRDRLQEKELNGASLKSLTEKEFTDMLQKRRDGERLVISRYRVRDLDLRDADLRNIDFHVPDLKGFFWMVRVWTEMM